MEEVAWIKDADGFQLFNDGLPLLLMISIREFIALMTESQLGEGVLLVFSPSKV